MRLPMAWCGLVSGADGVGVSAIADHHPACASAGVRFFGAFGRLNAIWGG